MGVNQTDHVLFSDQKLLRSKLVLPKVVMSKYYYLYHIGYHFGEKAVIQNRKELLQSKYQSFPEQLLKELCELRLRKEGEPRLTKEYSINLIEASFFNDGKKPAEQ